MRGVFVTCLSVFSYLFIFLNMVGKSKVLVEVFVGCWNVLCFLFSFECI